MMMIWCLSFNMIWNDEMTPTIRIYIWWTMTSKINKAYFYRLHQSIVQFTKPSPNNRRWTNSFCELTKLPLRYAALYSIYPMYDSLSILQPCNSKSSCTCASFSRYTVATWGSDSASVTGNVAGGPSPRPGKGETSGSGFSHEVGRAKCDLQFESAWETDSLQD